MAYVRLDKVKGSAHIESIVSASDLKNGQFLALGKLEADGEAYAVTPMSAGEPTENLVFHASVPLTYNDLEDELDFVLKAGQVGRAYVLEDGDIISISEDGIEGSLAEEAIVKPHVNGFEITVSHEGMQGKVIAIENDPIVGKLAVIRIIKK